MCTIFLHILERNYVLNTMLPLSQFKQFPRDYTLKLKTIQIFAVTLFITLAEKNSLYQKVFEILTYSGVEVCP